jgi:heterodisulfide reductase subunit B
VGYEAATAPVVKPLEGVRVACYYGCLLTRPPDVTGAERPEYPMNMDHLMEVTGAEAVDWSYKTECCSGSVGLTTLDIALDLSHKILNNAIEVGADLIATACPLCHANLDLRQKQINEEFGGEFDIPIVYFTQLMGVAYGYDAETLGLHKHFTDAIGLLESRGLLSE